MLWFFTLDFWKDITLKCPLRIRKLVSNYQHTERSLCLNLLFGKSQYPKCERKHMWSLIKLRFNGEKQISVEEWHIHKWKPDKAEVRWHLADVWIVMHCMLFYFKDNPSHFQLQPLQADLSVTEMTHESMCRV